MVMVALSTLLILEGGSGGESPPLVIQLVEGAGEKVLLDVLLDFALLTF